MGLQTSRLRARAWQDLTSFCPHRVRNPAAESGIGRATASRVKRLNTSGNISQIFRDLGQQQDSLPVLFKFLCEFFRRTVTSCIRCRLLKRAAPEGDWLFLDGVLELAGAESFLANFTGSEFCRFHTTRQGLLVRCWPVGRIGFHAQHAQHTLSGRFSRIGISQLGGKQRAKHASMHLFQSPLHGSVACGFCPR